MGGGERFAAAALYMGALALWVKTTLCTAAESDNVRAARQGTPGRDVCKGLVSAPRGRRTAEPILQHTLSHVDALRECGKDGPQRSCRSSALATPSLAVLGRLRTAPAAGLVRSWGRREVEALPSLGGGQTLLCC